MSGESLLPVYIGVLFGSLCAHLAKKKGLNPYIWFAIGFFLSVIALLIIVFVPPIDNTSKNEKTMS